MGAAMRELTRQIGRHAIADRKDDLYETPDVAVHALRAAEALPYGIWECACGRGAIVRVLRAAGHHVYATDLVDYGLEDSKYGIDFLLEQKAPTGVTAIVTNPPYKLGAYFVRRAIALVPDIFLLLRLDFYSAVNRADIFSDGSGFRGIHVFANRLPAMHRAGWTGPRVSSAVTYAWFVWSQGYAGRPFANRITWRAEP
jgi:hypothetical protein